MARKWQYKGIDTTFIDIENSPSTEVTFTLCPYGIKDKYLSKAFSFDSTKQRIKIVDKAISGCMRFK